LSAGQTRKTRRTAPLRAVKKANGLAGGAQKRTESEKKQGFTETLFSFVRKEEKTGGKVKVTL
jgi:hypothetical protein